MFTNDSRWDRHTPEQSHDEAVIDVGVIFKNGKMLPKTFVWQNRKYHIKEITYQWKETRGNEVLHFFTVTDGGNLFRIYLNNKYMHWRLATSCSAE